MRNPGCYLDKCVIWKKPDGALVHTLFLKVAEPGETDDEFIDRTCSRMVRDVPGYAAYERHVVDLKDVPGTDAIECWRMDASGKVFVDPALKTNPEKELERRDAARAELKALGVSDETMDLLLKR